MFQTTSTGFSSSLLLLRAGRSLDNAHMAVALVALVALAFRNAML